jgi:hypothetical protein
MASRKQAAERQLYLPVFSEYHFADFGNRLFNFRVHRHLWISDR